MRLLGQRARRSVVCIEKANVPPQRALYQLAFPPKRTRDILFRHSSVNNRVHHQLVHCTILIRKRDVSGFLFPFRDWVDYVMSNIICELSSYPEELLDGHIWAALLAVGSRHGKGASALREHAGRMCR